jgi:hypothetical protein
MDSWGGHVTGIEVAIGVLVTWLARKAKRVVDQVNSDVDDVLDAGVAKLHELVVDKLGTDPAVVKLHTEVEETGDASERTKDRVRLAVEQTFDDDPGFEKRFLELVSQIQPARGGRGDVVAQRDVIVVSHMTISDRSTGFGAVTGNVTTTQTHSAAAEQNQPDPSLPERT